MSILEEKVTENNPFDKSQVYAEKFDDATLKKDLEALKNLILEVEGTLNDNDIFYQAHVYYSLATATDTISVLEKDSNQENALKKQLYYYRKALKLIQTDEFNEPALMQYTRALQACIVTNYGNTLRRCGRRIAAIQQYISAQGYYPFFAMGMGNLGVCYMEYAFLLRDNQAYERDCLNYHAYNLLNDAIKSNDPNIHEEAKMYFISAISHFHVDYREYLSKPIELKKTPVMTKKEFIYRKWCLDNRLYLSPLNDLLAKEMSYAEDITNIDNLVASLDEGLPIAFGMFNQLKQEYISARFLYYESLQQSSNQHFSDNRTHLTETLDYAQFSLRIEKLKMSFKTLYGILDKIAYFMNAYYDLGIKEKDVSFRNIWNPKKYGENKKALDIESNFALASLYWIYQDFDDSYGQDSNPELKRLREIRNYLEHKYTIVTWDFAINNNEKKAPALYIDESELSEKTMELFHVVREAIICLSLSVNLEEIERQQKLGDKTILKMPVGKYEDDWKI